MHEMTVYRTVERMEAALIASARFQMLKRRVFQEAKPVYSIDRDDAAEVPCERPKKSSAIGRAARKSGTS
ncbi:hypothetical protein [Deinococcus hopiensis]|uniref:hypothetical protein n=1 Tax=Deinococcus hopiensis TaxID=309885 RepID=UPI001FE54863|nr:hypothetical protein [Deinococcus hopiensis]